MASVWFSGRCPVRMPAAAILRRPSSIKRLCSWSGRPTRLHWFSDSVVAWSAWVRYTRPVGLASAVWGVTLQQRRGATTPCTDLTHIRAKHFKTVKAMPRPSQKEIRELEEAPRRATPPRGSPWATATVAEVVPPLTPRISSLSPPASRGPGDRRVIHGPNSLAVEYWCVAAKPET